MAEPRIERLINLIAYLSDTRRSLMLREIIEVVPGYPEKFDSARRAFERDKEDLRSMGFAVVVELTPAGDSGYRIDNESTFFDIELDAQERNIIDYALENFSPEQNISRNAISKLGANNPENDLQGIRSLPLPKYLNQIFDAITKGVGLELMYKGTVRYIYPKKITAKNGFWYLSAIDKVKVASRTFRLDRIENLVVNNEDNQERNNLDLDTVEIEDTSNEENQIQVVLTEALSENFVKTWKGLSLEQPNRYQVMIENLDLFVNSLFDYSGFVSVIEPKKLVEEIDLIFDGVAAELEGSK